MITRIIVAVLSPKGFDKLEDLNVPEQAFFNKGDAKWPPDKIPNTRSFNVGHGPEKLIDIQGNESLKDDPLPNQWRMIHGATLENNDTWTHWFPLIEAEFMEFMDEKDSDDVRIVPVEAKELHQFAGEPKRF